MADTICYVAQAWATGTSYAVGDVVCSSSTRYQCNTAHTSGGTFGGDSSKWDSMGGGTCYTSLYNWNANQTKTISAGNREIVECYTFEDDATYLAMGNYSWDTSAEGAEIIIRAAAGHRHTGVPGTGYVLYGDNAYLVLQPPPIPRVTIDGIAFHGTHANAADDCTVLSVSNSSGAVIKNCLIYRDVAGAGQALAIINANSTDVKVINTIVVVPGSAVMLGQGYPSALFYNCAFVSTTGGTALSLGYTTGTINIKNCYLATSGTCFSLGDSTAAFTTCAHSSSQSITGSTGNVTYTTDNGEAMFVSVTSGSEDFHLQSGSALIGAGTDLSGDSAYPFNTDAAGVTRTSWDIGPYEYVPTGVTMTLMGGSVM